MDLVGLGNCKWGITPGLSRVSRGSPVISGLTIPGVNPQVSTVNW